MLVTIAATVFVFSVIVFVHAAFFVPHKKQMFDDRQQCHEKHLFSFAAICIIL